MDVKKHSHPKWSNYWGSRHPYFPDSVEYYVCQGFDHRTLPGIKGRRRKIETMIGVKRAQASLPPIRPGLGALSLPNRLLKNQPIGALLEGKRGDHTPRQWR